MKKKPEKPCVFKRARLLNECTNGHKQYVHHKFCEVCGKQVIPKYSADSWEGIVFNQTSSFQLIYELSDTDYSRAFISIFNNNLFLVQDNFSAFLLKGIYSDSDTHQRVLSFQIQVKQESINGIFTLNNNIYLHCGSGLFLLDWIKLLNAEFTEPAEVQCKGNILGITHHKQLYVYTESAVFRLDDTISMKEVFQAPKNESILQVCTHLDVFLIVSHRSSGEVCLRASNFGDMGTVSEEVLLPRFAQSETQIAAIGKDYYAVCLGGKTIIIGKISGLQSSKAPSWTLESTQTVAKLFFMKNYLHVFSGNQLSQWDLENFTRHPNIEKDDIALSFMPLYRNHDSSLLCVASNQGRNTYLTILDSALNEQSRSSSFSEQLINYVVSDNHIYAVTKADKTSYIYGG